MSGYARFIEDKTQFGGMVMIPIQAGNATTFTMVPIYDSFHAYELFDDKSLNEPSAIVATPIGKKLRIDVPVRLGGFLREIAFKDEGARTHQFYLETVLFTNLN